jgi:hypothetical protein
MMHAEFGEMANAFCDRWCLRRYLRSTKWNLEQSTSLLHATLAWRFETNPAKPCQLVRISVSSS